MSKRKVQEIAAADLEEQDLAAFLFKEDKRSRAEEAKETQPQPQTAVTPDAAWQDSDDEKTKVDVASKARTRKLRKTKGESEISAQEYERRLRTQFEKIHGRQVWAEQLKTKAAAAAAATSEAEEAETVVEAVDMRTISDRPVVALSKIRDVCRLEGGIMATAMIGNFLAVAAVEKVSVRLFSLGPKGAEEVAQLRLGRKFRVRGLQFLDERTLALVGPQRGVLFWDVQRNAEISYHPSPGGRFEREGWTHVRAHGNFVALASKSEISLYKFPGMTPVGTGARLNAEVVGLEFLEISENKISMFALDKAGSLYQISTSNGAIVDRKSHSSIFQPLSFSASNDGAGNFFLLIGCGSGVVEAVTLTADDRKIPADVVSGLSTKSFDRLTTPVETVVGIPGVSAFLAASKAKANAMRIGNLKNGHTLAGWPKNTDKFGMVVCACASDEFIVLGTVNGRILLFRRK